MAEQLCTSAGYSSFTNTNQAGDAAIHFDVIAVSMPGYAFSESPTEHGMSFARIADLVVHLMVEILGYKRFAVRGSDQGALVQQQIGLKYPERLIGIHRSGITPFLHPLPADLDQGEKAYQKQVEVWAQRETAYARLQALRPETLLPALADSPAGLASWIIEKFQRWGDCGSDPDTHFGRDKLVDNLSLHWFALGGAGAVRLYHQAGRDPGMSGRVEVPTAIAMPLRDGITVPAPRRWAERFYNVRQWTIMESGGHFPEWEIPAELTQDIRKFFVSLST
ncbi:alpha/beta fold hydrolase [Xanthocytophaga flava]|uniref:alpha/beta fold hydrolase n=1 Tax=Xanthocytophaga flava TaxID=3048013 RepID=UPI0028D3F697|nr:alpha/beta hydrolase [Xanthocytophaga flavus]